MATVGSTRRTVHRSQPAARSPWSVQAAALSDRGQVRTGNEDSVHLESPTSPEALARGILCVVADGMGGYNAGEVASRMAVQGIRTRYYSGSSTYVVDALRVAIETTNHEIWQQAQRQAETSGMGCTMTAAVIFGDELVIGHVGDSRAYLVRNNSIAQITRDHSWVEEQVEAGALTREQANRHPQRNVILRALGARSTINVDIFQDKVKNGDVIVLCSDGLSTTVTDDEIGRAVLDASPDVAVRQLIGLANQRGAPDNVSVAVLRVNGPARSRIARLRRWWPLVAAGVVLVALAGGLALANRPVPSTTPAPTLEAVQAPAAAQLPTAQPTPTPGTGAALPPLASDTPSSSATAVPRSAHIGPGGAFLRQAYDRDAPQVADLPGSEPVLVVSSHIGTPANNGADPTWYEVQVPRLATRGWVYGPLVIFDGATSTSAPSATLAPAGTAQRATAATPARAP